MKCVAIGLVLTLTLTPVFAETVEVSSNFWQELDIAFWQTLPFAVFWGYAVAVQMARGGEINWSPVLNVAVLISAGNAYFHARKVAGRQ